MKILSIQKNPNVGHSESGFVHSYSRVEYDSDYLNVKREKSQAKILKFSRFMPLQKKKKNRRKTLKHPPKVHLKIIFCRLKFKVIHTRREKKLVHLKR